MNERFKIAKHLFKRKKKLTTTSAMLCKKNHSEFSSEVKAFGGIKIDYPCWQLIRKIKP